MFPGYLSELDPYDYFGGVTVFEIGLSFLVTSGSGPTGARRIRRDRGLRV